MKIIITGVAGFIGMHLAHALLSRGDSVYGLDNLSNYYDVSLKEARLAQLRGFDNFSFSKIDLIDAKVTRTCFEDFKPNIVIHLAAQAGVRYSIENPQAYLDSNIQVFLNVLDICKDLNIKHFYYASSSSVYGGNLRKPFSEHDSTDKPLSFYAATKKMNELMAYTYSHLYSLPCTGLRFFTVYGPWGRPDMALSLFAEAILADKPIKLFNGGNIFRDFTYIDDVVESIIHLLNKLEKNKYLKSDNYKVLNVGGSQPSSLLDYLTALENALNKKAIYEIYPMQPGDPLLTYADVECLKNEIGYVPSTSITLGIQKFVHWFVSYHSKS